MRRGVADTASILGEVPAVIVTLYAPGFTVRGSTRALQVPNTSGDGPYLYDARVTKIDDIDREVDLFALERGEINSLRIEMTIPEDLTPMTLESQYHHLAASRCEVALIWEGETWAQRDVIIGRGVVSNLSNLGVSGEPISFVTEALSPPTGWAVGDPSREMGSGIGQLVGMTKLNGRQFPTIIGRCYRLPGFKTGDTSITTNKGLLLAGHHFAMPTVPTVYEDEDAPTAYVSVGALSFLNTTDVLGDPIAILDSSSASDFTSAQGAFTFDAEYGGVEAADGSNVAAVGAPAVISWLLANSGERVDFERNRRMLTLIAGLEIGVYVDKVTDALKILRDRVLSVLPLVEEQGEDGIWLRYIDIATQPAEADLVEGVHLIGRIGGMEQVSDPDEIYNSFTVVYGYDHATGRFGSSVTINKDNHPLCALSYGLMGGERLAPTVNVDITWDDATAAFIANSRANRLSLHRYATAWIADPSMYWLREGMIVSVTSESYGWTARKAVIRKIRATANPIRLVLEPLPGPLTGATF